MALAQPKKPVGGAYGAFLSEKRPEYTKLCAGQKASAISKMAGEEWAKLSAQEKEPHQTKYEAAKAQYDKDLKDFLAAGGVKQKGAGAVRAEKRKNKEQKEPKTGGSLANEDDKSKKDPNAPKRPAGGAYGVYVAQNREEIKKSLPKDHKITDVSKAAGVLWKALSEDAKKPYQAKYLVKQAEYKAEVAEYAKNRVASAVGGDDEADAKKEQVTPKKRPRTACKESADAPKAAKVGGRKGESASMKTPTTQVDAVSAAMLEVLKEAEGLGFASALKNLAARKEIAALCLPPGKLLTTLTDAGGLVNKAKAILLEG